MEVSDELIYNYFKDCQKKSVDPVSRAKLIKDYCKEKKISMRGLARELGMSHSTLQDWTDYTHITNQEIDALKNLGFKEKNIYKMLRENRTKTGKLESIKHNELNAKLTLAITELRVYINNPDPDEHTVELIRELKNVVNRLELHVEKKEQGR